MHEPIARKEGVSPETIETIRSRGPVDRLNPREGLIVEIAQSLCATRGLPDDLYERATKELSAEYLVELVTLVGFYVMIATILTGFDVDLPEGAFRPF